MELDWFEDFLTLAETNNFSRAADLRNITQPAFSRRIRALEQWIGAELFDRNTQRVALTPAGAQIHAEVHDLLRRLYAARDRARDAASAQGAALRILSTHVLSTTFFPGWMRRFQSPPVLNAPMSLVADNMARCEEAMLRGDAHFLLCHQHGAAHTALPPGHFDSIAVGADTLIAVSAPQPHAPAAPLHSIDDEMAALLEYSEGSGMGRIIRAVAPQGGTGSAPFASPLASVLFAMARDAKGLAWLPLTLIGDALARGDLVRAAPPARDIAIEIRLFRPRARQSAVAEALWAEASRL